MISSIKRTFEITDIICNFGLYVCVDFVIIRPLNSLEVMSEKNYAHNLNVETDVTAPMFDSTACRTARRVVPLPTNTMEEAIQIKAKFQSIANQPLPNIPDINQRIITSKTKLKYFLKYFLIATSFIFALFVGAVGGFALAHYQNMTDEKPGLAFIPQPALKEPKGMPKLELEVFEEPEEELPEENEDPTDENPNTEDLQIEPTPPRAEPSPPQTERRERRTTRPNQPTAKNKKPQQQTTEEYAREQLHKVREQLKRILD